MPIDQVFEFDTDEGIELAKANLYNQENINNISQFWSDHPPFFSIVIFKYLDLFGYSIINARILTLLFATLLIWCFSQILRLSLGRITAIVSIILLIISINFLRLSVSVMQGIPSLSLGMLSVYFLILYTRNLRLYLIILSGITLALSLQIKMIMLFLIPVILLYLFTSYDQLSPKKPVKVNLFNILTLPIVIWLLSLSIVFMTIGLMTQSLDLEKILFFHFSPNLKDTFSNENSFKNVIYIYLQNFDYLLLSLLGVKYQNIKTDNTYKIPLFWLIILTFVFLNHKPLWYHYMILISLPLVWLAAYGIKVILEKIRQINHPINILKLKQAQFSKFAIFTVIFTLFVIPIKLGIIQWENHNFVQKSPARFINLERILTYKNQSQWLFTDMGMYGFYSQINIPPEITVISRKRLNSGSIDSEFLFKVLEKYKPEQILINRFPSIFDLIKPYIEKNYQEIYVDKSTKHYLKKNIQKLS
ncbi:glycosyltransferase family 39 protein [Cronbergia sp. UHCC 0137]|uniref:glycosyltransferase family 39 protein n=1 Tax=Cronbergia sp. UHCC 0137 TaxID=3110239 RepID=UPI002B21E878|nr:glycosyltransferase family 39 protein [Cronbergia sp. UHCC 0137]MEA5617649.1 glycosyltransferase family 39 protein [Cronbergia sp. UHCC 0137]